MADSFATRAHLSVNGKSYAYPSLTRLVERFDLARLPYSMKILLENLLRHEDRITVTAEQIQATDEEGRILLLAELDGNLVGCGIAARSHFAGRGFVAPRVLPDFRRRGVGTALLLALTDHIRSLGREELISFVYANEAGSVAFAERFGQEVVDRSTTPLLLALEDLHEYHAATGTFQVVVDREVHTRYVPSVISGERVEFLATGRDGGQDDSDIL